MWEKIKNEVLVDLEALQKYTQINKLHVTGISLGGGLATIAFMDIMHLTSFTTVNVTTFGAPKVGN